MGAVIFQTIAAGTVGGVGVAWIAYAIGIDRLVVRVVRHPLQSLEIVVAVALSWLPVPSHGYRGRRVA